ncbi:MAG TPA: HDIG domain-containing protein [Blastocatellia bacterium]|nr:HDIG domain-containing protein [Blastocatellia bacterium]
MSKKRQWSWLTRLENLPQRAERRFTTQFHRIPQRIRFFILISLISILTTLLVSNFPISILPSYRVGDVVEHDVVAPVELIVKDDVGDDNLAERLKRNPVLLHAGETVTAEKLPLIERVRQYELGARQPKRIIGLLALVGMMFFALYKSAVTSQSSRLGPRTAFWVASSALMFQTLLARVGMFGASVLSARPETGGLGGFFELQFAIPFAACALALSLLIGSQVALVAALMSALLVGFISPHDLAISAFAFAGSVVAIYSVQRYRTRNAVMVAAAAVAGVNAVMGAAASLIANNDWNWKSVLGGVVLGIAGAALTAGVASFAIPIYESVFDILTDLKLLELSNADNPLLRQLAIRTPGTSYHSFMVGVLAEEAAKAIGANALLARTACLYHDIGKLAAPNMYIENQKGGPNPHDKVSPLDSVRVITGHVRRGIEMAIEADLPPQIIDFIPQHHGTRVLAYFYHKAKAQAEARGGHVNMDDFRYPGPKPQSKEAVILMLGDGAEASVRSLEEHTPENIRAIVKKIVDSVSADGQLDESNITMRELTTIRESLINTLINIYHQRISYPGFNPPSKTIGEVEREMADADVKSMEVSSVAARK